jgi:hypothetical protein
MKSFFVVGLLLVALVIACISLTVGKLPAAQAQPAVRLPRWEYQVATAPSPTDLNRLGNDGWELVVVREADERTPSRFIFKRPKP